MPGRSGQRLRERLISALLMGLILPPEGNSSLLCKVAAFSPVPPLQIAARGCQAAAPLRVPLHQLLSGLHHDPVDDDDVSQHDFMVKSGQNQTSVDADDKSENTDTKRKGYRPIEDWHDEYRNKNADEFKAITHLRRERARWGKTFESLGGDGI